MTKLVLESGLVQEREDRCELTGPLPTLAIPTTLRDALMAHLDRLTTAKAIAQLGATLGRTFPYELLHAMSQLDEAALPRELGRLVEAELVYQDVTAVIADTDILSAFGKIGRLDLLQRLFQCVYIAPVVSRELLRAA
jgi:hypothetical protein